MRAYDDPRLQLSGWFCQGGADFIERSTLACALDRLTLLSAGSEPKVGALFAQAELNRSFCGQRNPILASTPKYQLLWGRRWRPRRSRRIGRLAGTKTRAKKSDKNRPPPTPAGPFSLGMIVFWQLQAIACNPALLRRTEAR